MDAPMDSVINRAEVDWKSRLPALQRKVAMAVLQSGYPRIAQEILLRKPIVLPDGTLKANLDFTDIYGDPPKGVGPAGSASHRPVAEVDAKRGVVTGLYPERINNGGRGFLVSYQTDSYDRLTDHLGDYDDDPEAHDEIYSELGEQYRRAVVDAADSVLRNHRKLPKKYAEDLENLIVTMQKADVTVWDIAGVIEEKTAFYTTQPGDIWMDAVVLDAGIFDDWADGVLGTDSDDWMVV